MSASRPLLAAVVLLPLCGAGPIGSQVANMDLEQQLGDDPERVLPRTEMLSFAADGHGFYRATAAGVWPGYYHSGIWLDLYGEARPFDELALNLRATVANPGASYGIVSTTDLILWPGATIRKQLGAGGPQLQLRFFDQGRRTLGAGLFVQDQEASGVSGGATWGPVRAWGWWFGTSTLDLGGDLEVLGFDLWDDAIGAWGGITEGMRTRAAGIYTAHEVLPGLTPLAEGSNRMGAWAGMVGLDASWDPGGALAARVRVQGRTYADGYADDVEGAIQQDYVALDQEQLDFVRADNLFVYDDGVSLAAGRAVLTVRPWPWLHLLADNEVARLWWQDRSEPQLWWFWRYDAMACLRSPDNLCLDVVFSNRMSSAVVNGMQSDLYNYPLLYDRTFLGIEGRARF